MSKPYLDIDIVYVYDDGPEGLRAEEEKKDAHGLLYKPTKYIRVDLIEQLQQENAALKAELEEARTLRARLDGQIPTRENTDE